jgi:hypothetical protein
MAKLSDVYNESVRELLGNFCLTACTLAINAASAATFRTTGTTTYTVDGRFRTKAALSAQAFSPVAGFHAGVPIGQVGYYVVALDAAGTVRTFEGIGMVPDVDNGFTPIGIIKVVANSVAFVPGTTALDNAGLAVTYTDVAILPAVSP